MRRLLFCLLLGVVLVACNNDPNDDTTTPTYTPEPTSVFAANFDGPLLNPAEEPSTTEIIDCSLDPDATACGVGGLSEDVETAGPLALTSTTWSGLQVGIPEGFETIELNNKLLMEPTDRNAHPGEPIFILSQVENSEVDVILGRYVDLNENQLMYRDNGLGEGYVLPNAGRGMVGVWPLGGAQSLVIEVSVLQGYWPAYAATFNALTTEIMPIS